MKTSKTGRLKMYSFDDGAHARLARAHPRLQDLMNEAIKQYPFTILDSQRGRKAQEEAFRKHYSKVHFGDSAHNWKPSVALDLAPLPLSWDNAKKNLDRWTDLQIGIIKPLAKKMGITIRQGIDWNGNGDLTDEKWDDLPHVELSPWREWAKRDCQLFEGP